MDVNTADPNTVLKLATSGAAVPAPGVYPRRRHLVIAALVLAGFAVIAVYIYRPFVARPFDILDFSEFLPILRAHADVWSRFSALVEYYVGHGRFSLLGYFFLSAKWSLFGWNEAGWQIARAVQMIVLCGVTYAVLIRLGFTRAGATAGAILFVVSGPAARAWVRVNMAEPFGTIAIASAALCGTFYQSSRRWRRIQAAVVGLIASALLIKEMLIAAVPLVLFICCSRAPNGQFERPKLSRRNIELVLATTGVSTAILVPVALVALNARTGGYATAYGAGDVGILDLVRLWLTTLIPFVPLDDPMSPGLTLASLSYFGLLGMGLKLFSLTTARQSFAAVLAIGLVHPLLGAVVYVPWPAYQWFYSVPFLLGPAVLIAAATSGIERYVPKLRWLAYAACICTVGNMASESLRFSRRSEAVYHLTDAATAAVSSEKNLDSVFVAAREMPAQAWQGLGPTLERYGRATDRPFPPTIDVPCSDAEARAQVPKERHWVLVFSSHCVLRHNPRSVETRTFTWFDWGRAAVVRDSVFFAVFAGSADSARSSEKPGVH